MPIGRYEPPEPVSVVFPKHVVFTACTSYNADGFGLDEFPNIKPIKFLILLKLLYKQLQMLVMFPADS